MVEIEYLISLSDQKEVKELGPMSETDKQKLRKIYKSFSLEDAKRVKAIEVATNHDVKAVEYYIRERLEKMNKKRMFPWIHFALTSEDINNLSYSLMWQDALKNQFIPELHEVIKKLNSIAKQFSTTPMLSLTHGQSATPTTFGKEISVFVHRLNRQSYHSIIRVNNILIDLCRDIWSYVSRGILKQKRVPGEIGSSTMPHKINPIQFENAEGNLGIAISILSHLSNKLPISRMQRDLTDSTTLRNQGIAMGYGYLACKNILKGLRRITINKTEMKKELNTHWEVLAEAVQTILRKSGSDNAYEQLKNITQGEIVTQESILDFVKLLRIPEEDKKRLVKLTPEEYIGIAPALVSLK